MLESLTKLSSIIDFSWWNRRNIFFRYCFLIQIKKNPTTKQAQLWLFIVAKLSWKKTFFFRKNICVFYKIYIICRKKTFLCGKKIIMKIFFTEKKFFYREKYKWKYKKYISHFKNKFLHRKCLCYIYSFCKKKKFWPQNYIC